MKDRDLMKRLGIEYLDLRKVTRKGVSTLISIGRDRENWIECGPIDIPHPNNYSGHRLIGSRMGRGATDMDHDSAWAFRIPVIGLEFEMISGSTVFFSGFIAAPEDPEDEYDLSDFCLPTPADDRYAEAVDCSYCSEKHPIIDYLPEPNGELYKKLAGQRIFIVTRPDS